MDIFGRVKTLNLPVGEYVVVGGVMEAHGIRPAADIDIIVSPKLFEELVGRGWRVCDCEICKKNNKKMLKGDGVDIISEYSWENVYRVDAQVLIENADMINGIPFTQLTELLKWKRAAAREKDLQDANLIEDYLRSKERSQ